MPPAALSEPDRSVRAMLREFARENLRHVTKMAEMEELCDSLKEELKRTKVANDHLQQENVVLRTWKQLYGLAPRYGCVS